MSFLPDFSSPITFQKKNQNAGREIVQPSEVKIGSLTSLDASQENFIQ